MLLARRFVAKIPVAFTGHIVGIILLLYFINAFAIQQQIAWVGLTPEPVMFFVGQLQTSEGNEIDGGAINQSSLKSIATAFSRGCGRFRQGQTQTHLLRWILGWVQFAL